jgi:hypothetical protein
MSLPLDQLVEERIRQAQREGAFDDLPGAGRPLQLDDDALVPEELRMVCRVLKNAGYVPPEVEHLRELRQLEALALDESGTQRRAARKRMELLLLKLEQAGMGRVAQQAWAEYADKIAARLRR